MLDRDGPVPLYVQVARVIQERIARGELRSGEAVPSEAELEAEFDIARTTARRVARELRDSGIAYTVPGQGTFVGPPTVGRQVFRRVPLYRVIAGDLAGRIQRGSIRQHRAIPSEKTIMQQYGVSKVTSRQAIAYLREQGWVFTVPQRGTFVTSPENWPKGESS